MPDHRQPSLPLEGEHCQDCGRVYDLMGWWMAPDDLWEKVTGKRYGGLFCPDCFGKRAAAKGLHLRWSVEIDR